MEHNKELCRKFVANALPYLDGDCGEIHMAHKTKPPYNQWLLEKVALEAIADQYNITRKYGRDFEYKGRMVLDRCALLPYTPRKALDRRSFPCHDACIYVFGWRNDDASDREHPLSTIKAPCATSKESDSMPTNPSSIVPVTTNMVDNIRSIHINYLKRKPNDSSNKRNGSKSKRRKKF